jgi:hypothetical protein
MASGTAAARGLDGWNPYDLEERMERMISTLHPSHLTPDLIEDSA